MVNEKSLRQAGVRNLKEYGYPDVDENNITTDMIYSKFFKGMLEDNLGQGFDAPIKVLIAECDKVA